MECLDGRELANQHVLVTLSLQQMDREMISHSGVSSGMAATASATAMRIMRDRVGLSGFEGSVRFVVPSMVNSRCPIGSRAWKTRSNCGL